MKKNWLLIPSIIALSAAPFICLSGCKTGGEDEPEPTPPEPEPIGTCFAITALEESEFHINCDYCESLLPPDLSYSINGGATWKKYEMPKATDSDGPPINIEQGNTILLKGENPNGFNKGAQIWRMMISGDVKLSGNIMSLIDNGECKQTTIPSVGCFSHLFDIYDSERETYSSIIDIKDLLLPATTLKEGCYQSMFGDQQRLKTSIAELPAMELQPFCYANMFWSCYSLCETPYLPAKTLKQACYICMFAHCTTLKVKEISETNVTETTQPILTCPEYSSSLDVQNMFLEINSESEWEGTDPLPGYTYYWYHD